MARPWIGWISRIAVAIVVVIATLALLWVWWPPPPGSPIAIVVPAVVVLAVVLVWAVWWLWWRLPQRYVARLAIQIHDPKARADAEDNLRKTVGQALGGAAVLIGAVVAYLQFTQQQQATRDQLSAAHDLLISNQVSKGFEQLAGKEMAMRLGGIYALEGVMNTSAQYHQPVLEALCAFVREGTIRQQMTFAALLGAMFGAARNSTGQQTDVAPATDIQAALTVIGRRGPGMGVVNLTAALIPFANLSGVNLRRANLSYAILRGANLEVADLRDANLHFANLSPANPTANPSPANLRGAYLDGADLSNAYLRGASLEGAHLSGAILTGADLRDAYLYDADLSGAHLKYTILEGAHLSGAILTGADLRDAFDLFQAQLDKACGSVVTLPPGVALKPCPVPGLEPKRP